MKLLMTVLLILPAMAAAQQPDDTAPPPPPPCSDPAYRQFDFWIGEWTVTANDQLAGTNTIRPIHGGCALEENWQGAGEGGVSGSSFNIYDMATDHWHQTWVDGHGLLLQLDGGLVDGAMVMRGRRPARDGSGMVTHRISWTPNADGSVRQLWEATRDGQHWTVVFDGLYTRAAADE